MGNSVIRPSSSARDASTRGSAPNPGNDVVDAPACPSVSMSMFIFNFVLDGHIRFRNTHSVGY